MFRLYTHKTEVSGKKYTYLRIVFPDDLIKKCNFEKGDKFSVSVNEKTVTIKYNPEGEYPLSLNGGGMALGVSLNQDDFGWNLNTLGKTDVQPEFFNDYATVRVPNEFFNIDKGFHRFIDKVKGFAKAA